MTLPNERTRSVIETRNFLLSLLNPKETPRVPKQFRQRAGRLLRHFPTELDMELVGEGKSEVFDARFKANL